MSIKCNTTPATEIARDCALIAALFSLIVVPTALMLSVFPRLFQWMLGHEGAEEEAEEMVEAAHVCRQVAAQMSCQVDAALATRLSRPLRARVSAKTACTSSTVSCPGPLRSSAKASSL